MVADWEASCISNCEVMLYRNTSSTCIPSSTRKNWSRGEFKSFLWSQLLLKLLMSWRKNNTHPPSAKVSTGLWSGVQKLITTLLSSSSTPVDHQRSQAGEQRSDILKARLCLPEVTAAAAPAEVAAEPAQLPPTLQAASPTQGPGVRGLYSTCCTEHAFSPIPYLNLTPDIPQSNSRNATHVRKSSAVVEAIKR